MTQHSWLLAGWLAGCLAGGGDGGGGGGGTGAATGGTGGAPPTPPPPHRHTPTPTPHYTTLHHATHSARGLYACLVKRIGSSRGREKKRERERVGGWVERGYVVCMARGDHDRGMARAHIVTTAPPAPTSPPPPLALIPFSFLFSLMVW